MTSTDMIPSQPASACMRRLSLACAAALAVATLAAWTTTSSTPTTLIGGANDQVQAKVLPLPSGGFVMSCFDNATGGYDVRVNRFDDRGAPMWGAAGVLVADRSVSSTTDYGACAAPDGGIIVIYQATTGAQMAVSRVSGSGTVLWTQTLTATTDFVANGKAVVDSTGGVYVAWLQGTSTRVQKVNYETGASEWATPTTLSETGAQQQIADMRPAVDGAGVAVSTVRYTTFSGPKLLRAWRVSSAGAVVWGPKVVFATGSLQTANYPPMAVMPGVGYVFGFYTTTPLQSWIQVIDSSGNPLTAFGTNGLAVTATATGYNRTNPAVAVDASGGIVYVNWYQNVPNTSIYGCSAQALSVPGGQRLWGDFGLALSPDATTYSITQTSAAFRPGFGAAFGWVNSSAFGSETLWARAVDANGADRWPAGAVTASAASSKGRAQAHSACGGFVWVWENGGTGNADLVGVRVGLDGVLGDPASNPADLNGDGSINGVDLAELLAAWGSSGGSADINGDSTVNGIDLAVLLAAWTG